MPASLSAIAPADEQLLYKRLSEHYPAVFTWENGALVCKWGIANPLIYQGLYVREYFDMTAEQYVLYETLMDTPMGQLPFEIKGLDSRHILYVLVDYVKSNC